MNSTTILDSRLSVRLDLDISIKGNMLFQYDPRKRGHLANQLLLYESIAIPTKDFGIVPILINWLGLKAFQELVEAGTLRFVHKPTVLGYSSMGSEAGLSLFTIEDTPEKPHEWWSEAMFGSAPRAVELQLTYGCPFVAKADRTSLATTILGNTREIEIAPKDFDQHVKDESLRDIMGEEKFVYLISKAEGIEKGKVDIRNLRTVKPHSVSILNIDMNITSPVDLVLAVAETNFDILISRQLGDCDLYVSQGADRLMKNKMKRSGLSPTAIDGFTKLLELNDVPDVGSAIARGETEIADIIKLRNKSVAKEFRTWLRKADVNDTRELEKLYVASMSEINAGQRLPVRVLRFVLTQGIGLLGPLAGLASGVIDSFFVDGIGKGHSPRLFIDELRKLPN